MRAFIIAMLVLSCTAYAQIPRTISFQGVLTDAQGNLVADGNHQLSLTLFDAATNGNPVFTESHTVPVVNGLFNAIIGSVTPLPASLAFDRAYFLGVRVDGAAELSPRTPLTAVPYALRAATADVAQALAPGATGVVRSINNQSGALTIQGAGGTTVTNTGTSFTISSTGGGGTGIQGVQSTDGSLTIANPNGPVANLSIAEGSVTGSRIADGSVTAADIAPGVIPDASGFVTKGSSAGGDLSGNYPDPSVANGAITSAKLANASVSSQHISAGQVVRQLNGLTDDVTLAAGANITITPNGNALTISSGLKSVQRVQNDNNTLDVINGDGPITTVNLKANGVGTAHLADGAVTAAKLAPGVLPTSLPPNGSAGGDLTGSYPNPVIAGNAVASAEIQDGSIGTTDIADNAVTIAKIGSTGAGNGQVITYNGSDVVWQSPATGVTGSGVANRLAFWTAAGSLGSDGYFSLSPGPATKLALGYQCSSTGDYSAAIGAQCVASGTNTVAIGAGATASTNGAMAFGVAAEASGTRSMAIGHFVTASNGGSCVMGDNNTTTLSSSASNQMSMRFVGGYRLFTNSAFSTGVTMAAGVSGWTNICDRNLKEHFTPVDGEWLLGRIRLLPVSEWSYKDADPNIRYIGPMAQDFHTAFGLGGSDSTGINSIIADGVNLAAIKALEARTRALQETVSAQQRTIDRLMEELRTRRVRQASVRRAS